MPLCATVKRQLKLVVRTVALQEVQDGRQAGIPVRTIRTYGCTRSAQQARKHSCQGDRETRHAAGMGESLGEGKALLLRGTFCWCGRLLPTPPSHACRHQAARACAVQQGTRRVSQPCPPARGVVISRVGCLCQQLIRQLTHRRGRHNAPAHALGQGCPSMSALGH